MEKEGRVRVNEVSGAHFVRQALINYQLPITNYQLQIREIERF